MKSVKYLSANCPVTLQIRNLPSCSQYSKPEHLICFKQWTAGMVMNIIDSAINLKRKVRNTHQKRLVRNELKTRRTHNKNSLDRDNITWCKWKNFHYSDILKDAKVTILQEVNEPTLNLAVSKAATFLGAYDVNITDNLLWDHDYNGSILSYMTDVIFVSTSKHMCVQRFANKSTVPVLCMRSRTHASIQSMSTVMAIIEELGTMKCLNVSYLGATHPILNSYLLLCPMLGANIRFKCCCEQYPVSPLLYKASEDMTAKSSTETKACTSRDEVLQNCNVVIAGPTTRKKEKKNEFKVTTQDIAKNTQCDWRFFHTCPRGEEVDDKLFNHCNARTFNAFQNMHYIAAALMANAVKGYRF